MNAMLYLKNVLQLAPVQIMKINIVLTPESPIPLNLRIFSRTLFILKLDPLPTMTHSVQGDLKSQLSSFVCSRISYFIKIILLGNHKTFRAISIVPVFVFL